MATIKSNGFKFHTCETNRIESLLTGNTFAQLKLSDEFVQDRSATAETACQNGMFLVYDEMTGEVRKPADDEEIVYLQYSAPLLYDMRDEGAADFAVGVENDFLPVMIPVQYNDVITTDAVVGDYDTIEKEHYATVNADGFLEMRGAVKPANAAVVLQVKEKYTMPHGGRGIKFVVVSK